MDSETRFEVLESKLITNLSDDAPKNEPLAIVGIGCRFPGGIKDPRTFWDLVKNAKDGIVDVPKERWDADWFYSEDREKPGKTFVRKGGFIDQPVDQFDAMFFGIAPREAERMDPQQRLLLETAWEAFEDAGIPSDRVAGSKTGVFVGAFTFDNQITQMGIASRHLIAAQTPTSSTFTMLSNRISYVFDLRGPSVSIDTACSSSLVAFHQACQAIWQGECTMALAGGANMVLRPETVISMCKGGFLSPDGRSKSFDARANGYGRGEGSGIVVIKPLSQAVADNDRIYCVVRGTGVNQDGRTNGITVPNPDSQISLCRKVCQDAGVDPATIEYVEAHGTGTPVGDPIEANSLGTIYGQARDDGETVALGSIKANFGHTEAAAGVAGVIKACLTLHHATIPPLAYLDEPNPNIPFAELGLRLPRTPEPMSGKNGTPRAAINSFGYGGTNAHAILERYVEPTRTVAGTTKTANGKVNAPVDLPATREIIFPLSARGNDALKAAVQAMVEALPQLEKNYSLNEICYVAATRRQHHSHRLAVRCGSIEDLKSKLQAYLVDGQAEGVITGKVESISSAPVFVFTGMGPQWWGMGRELMQEEPVFRAAVEECDAILQRIAGWSIIEELAKDEATSRVGETQIAQPANFVVQYGLTQMLAARGITPSAILGHSVGEVSAACVAGVLSLEDALTVSFHRSRIQKKAAGQGGMLAVGLPESEAIELLKGHEDGASIAAINSPNSVTLAGDVPVLEQIAELLQEREVFNRMLEVEVPYHSHFMDPLKPETLECLAGLNPTNPKTQLYSTVTANEVTDVRYDARYWCDNIREPVRFADTIATAIEDGHSLFLEVGPHPVLSTSLRECILESGNAAATAMTLRRKQPELATFTDGISAMFCGGLELDWDAFLQKSDTFVPLPLYRFQRESHWFESRVANFSRIGIGQEGHPLLWSRTPSHRPTWQSPLTVGLLPFIPDHQVDGVVVFPGAGYIESVLALHYQLTNAEETTLTDIEFSRALVIDGSEEPFIVVGYDEQTQNFTVHSRPDEQTDDSWTAHATGVISAIASEPVEKIDLAAVRARCNENIEIDQIYDRLASRGLVYGPHFRRMTSLSRGGAEAIARIEPHEAPGRNIENYRLHPTMLDACFQSLISLLSPEHGGNATFVPVGIDRLTLRKVPKGGFWSVGELVQATPTTITGHLTLVDDDGEVIGQVRGFRCQSLAGGSQNVSAMLSQIAYEVQWEKLEAVSTVERTGRWLVFTDENGVANDLLKNWGNHENVAPIVVRNGNEFAEVDDDLFQVPFSDADSLQQLVEKTDEVAGVVWLHGINETGKSHDSVEGLEAVDAFAKLIRVLDALERKWRVYGITRNAHRSIESDQVNGIEQSPLVGLMKVALNEYPDLRITTIDIDDSAESISALSAELLADSNEDGLSLRNGERYAERIVRTPVKGRDAELVEEVPETIAADTPFVLEQSHVGSIDSLTLRQVERRAPGPGEVEIKLVSTSLNFKDVAKVMNIMSDAALEGTFHEKGLGLEAAGKVVRVGEGIEDFQIGDSVIFSMQGCFRNYATIKVEPHVLFKVPDNVDLILAGGTPTVFMTTYHALCEVANLQKGEKVLIHAGAGGVGLSAIQIAQWLGAEIFATAGSDEKRDYLRSLGVQHVMNSRSLEFAEQIMEITGGKGVDVVLNSLPKEYIHKSIEVLAPFGRFVEIGKKDLVEGTSISLQPFNKVLSFSTIDFDIMAAQKPEIVVRVVNDILKRFKTGDLKPIRSRVFPPSQLRDAFKHMARSKHIGKVIIDWEAEETVEALPPIEAGRVFKSDGRYLITGGCGGFGLAIAQWLVERGVKHLALVGRSGAKSDEAKATIADMRSAGATVDVMKVDVTDRDAVQEMIEVLSAQEVPLKGVLHAAAVLDDDAIADLNRDRFENVMRPKIVGARNLDACTQNVELDLFVLFSSVASMVGNIRQANYVAANAWFDAFASHRRARGLAGTSINWGPIADVGMAATSEALIKTLAASGFGMTTVDDGMQALEHALRWHPTQLGLFEIDWPTWAGMVPASGGSPRFAEVVASGSDDPSDHPLFQQLSELAEEDRTDVLNYLLIEQIAETLRIPADKLEPTDSINDLGMDSLMAVELQTLIRLNMGVELSALEMMKGENIGQMGAMIMGKMNLGSSEGAPEPSASEVDVDQMSDEEVEKLLQSVAE